MEKNKPKKVIVNSLDFTHETYQSWVSDICTTIEAARLQTSLKVNADLLQLYFTIRKEILKKQETQGWGAQIIDLLSADLQKCYKGKSDYSDRILGYTKNLTKQYPDFLILQASLAKLDEAKTNVQVPLA